MDDIPEDIETWQKLKVRAKEIHERRREEAGNEPKKGKKGRN